MKILILAISALAIVACLQDGMHCFMLFVILTSFIYRISIFFNKKIRKRNAIIFLILSGIAFLLYYPAYWKHRYHVLHGIQRINCSELAAYALEWAEKSMLEQDDDSTAQSLNFIATLAGSNGGVIDSDFNFVQWIADTGANNWQHDDTSQMGIPVIGHNVGREKNFIPKKTVKDFIPEYKEPWNPFTAILSGYNAILWSVRDYESGKNGESILGYISRYILKEGKSVFDISSFPMESPKVGAIACAGKIEEYKNCNWVYFSLLYQNEDSTGIIRSGRVETSANTANVFHAGQDAHSMQGLRNGIFLGRFRTECCIKEHSCKNLNKLSTE